MDKKTMEINSFTDNCFSFGRWSR